MFEIIISILMVSIDGFFIGLAFRLKNTKIKFKNLIIIGIIPIIMALPVMIIGNNISRLINRNIINIISCLLFLFLSYNSYTQIKRDIKVQTLNLANTIIIGLSIGLDSSLCAFTLSLHNYNPYITPIYFGISHFILILLGNTLLSKVDFSKLKYIKYINPIIFLIMAILKLF